MPAVSSSSIKRTTAFSNADWIYNSVETSHLSRLRLFQFGESSLVPTGCLYPPGASPEGSGLSRTIAVRLTRDVCKSQSFEEEPSPSPSKISNYKTNPLRVAVSSPIKEGTQLKRDGPRTPSRRTHRGGPPKFRFNSSENLTGTLAERPVCARVMPTAGLPAASGRISCRFPSCEPRP
jgi:hypothetical protein